MQTPGTRMTFGRGRAFGSAALMALGALAVNVQPLDLALLLVFGLLGLMMRRFGLPVLPLIIGVILGPRIERQLRQSLQLADGDWSGLFTEPVAIITYALMVILLFEKPLYTWPGLLIVATGIPVYLIWRGRQSA